MNLEKLVYNFRDAIETAKEIAKLYDVSEYAVNKQRRSFGVNPISSTLDRMKRNM